MGYLLLGVHGGHVLSGGQWAKDGELTAAEKFFPEVRGTLSGSVWRLCAALGVGLALAPGGGGP